MVFLYNFKKSNTNINDQNGTIKRIVKLYGFFCKRELIIGNRIKMGGENYENIFNPVNGYKKLKITDVDDVIFDDIVPCIENMGSYILMEYITHSSDSFADYYNFSRGLKNERYTRVFILKIIQSFTFGIKTLSALKELDIVHMEIYPKNIQFIKDNYMMLSNFTHSFYNGEIEDERKSTSKNIFGSYDKNNIYWPLEVQMLCYLNENGLHSLSKSNINEVIYDFNCCHSKSSIGKYTLHPNIERESECRPITQLINLSAADICREIFKMSATWNAYSYGILFLHLIAFIEDNIGSSSFTTGFSHILIDTIHFDWTKRECIDQVGVEIDRFVYGINEKDWIDMCRC